MFLIFIFCFSCLQVYGAMDDRYEAVQPVTASIHQSDPSLWIVAQRVFDPYRSIFDNFCILGSVRSGNLQTLLTCAQSIRGSLFQCAEKVDYFESKNLDEIDLTIKNITKNSYCPLDIKNFYWAFCVMNAGYFKSVGNLCRYESALIAGYQHLLLSFYHFYQQHEVNAREEFLGWQKSQHHNDLIVHRG